MTEESYTDDADVSQLETRIDELEATIRKMLPSRREAIGMGVAGLAGASLMSGTASAGSAQVGTIGDNSNLVDLVAEDVTITDTLNTASLSGAEAGEALLSDGSGNLTFGSGGGGILRNGSEIDYVALDVSNLPTSTGSGEVALVTALDQYVEDNPLSGTPFDITSTEFGFASEFTLQEDDSKGITFNDTGTKMYDIERTTGEIHQYALTNPFEVSSASLEKSINAQDQSVPTGITFNDDGTRLYESGNGADKFFQSNLSTPFDIGTASFQTSISSNSGQPQDIVFNDDGTRLYEPASDAGGDIYQFNLSSAFDISSASFDTGISSQSTVPLSLAFNDTGTKMVELGDNDVIFQFNLSTPFDISSASFTTSINGHVSGLQGIEWNADGSKFYQVGHFPGKVYEFNVTTGGWEAF